MKPIFKIIAILVGFMLPIFLFIMLYRLNKGLDPFFGFSSFITWFESQDFVKPISQTIDDFTTLTNTYNSWFAGWQEINNFWDILTSLVQSIGAILGYLSYPVILIWKVVTMFIDYITMFYDFFVYIGS